MILLLLIFTLWSLYSFILYKSELSLHTVYPENTHLEPKEAITVVVAARNEEVTIQACIHALLNQQPETLLKEIIIVDDHSEDNMREKVLMLHHPKIRYMQLPPGMKGKKAAITQGVSLANSDIIAITDADSYPANEWLRTIENYFRKQPNLGMVTGFVFPYPIKTWLDRFQWLDFAATMTLTKTGFEQGWFYLANGANMAFRKSIFEKVGGYSGNEAIASGDDVFLMAKVSKLANHSVAFMSNPGSRVHTKTEPTWNSFWQQRKRWAQKTQAYASPGILFVQGLTFSLVALWWIFLLATVIGYTSLWKVALLAGGLKFVSDYVFLSRLSQRFQEPSAMKFFPVSWMLYQVYIILAGWTALFPGQTQWKNRFTTKS